MVVMTTTTVEDLTKLARKHQAQQRLAQRDGRRAMRDMSDSGMTPYAIAEALDMTVPDVASAIATADLPIPQSFSGSSPTEICERYTAGEIDRDRAVNELSRWEYTAPKPTDGYDWDSGESGSFVDEVVSALFHHLIDPEMYRSVLQGSDQYTKLGVDNFETAWHTEDKLVGSATRGSGGAVDDEPDKWEAVFRSDNFIIRTRREGAHLVVSVYSARSGFFVLTIRWVNGDEAVLDVTFNNGRRNQLLQIDNPTEGLPSSVFICPAEPGVAEIS